MLNNKGQAGEIAVFVILVFMVAFAYIFISPIVQNIKDVVPTISDATLWTNAQTQAMNWLFRAWYAFPFFAFIALLVWLIKRAIEKRSGEVM